MTSDIHNDQDDKDFDPDILKLTDFGEILKLKRGGAIVNVKKSLDFILPYELERELKRDKKELKLMCVFRNPDSLYQDERKRKTRIILILPNELESVLSDPKRKYKNKSHWRGKRKRHPLYHEANSIVKKTHFYDPAIRKEYAQEIVEIAKEYQSDVKDKRILLRGENENGMIVWSAMPYTTRFSEQYIKQQIIELDRAMKDLQFGDFMYLLTLTIDPKRFLSIEEGYRACQRETNKLLTRLRSKIPNFRYVGVREIQSANTMNIHFHYGISITTNYSRKDMTDLLLREIKTYWSLGFSDLKYVEYRSENGITGMYKIRNYLEKYLMKGLKLDNEHIEYSDYTKTVKVSTNNAILWALNSRVFSTSNITNFKKWFGDNGGGRLDHGGVNNSNGAIELDNSFVWEYAGSVYAQDVNDITGLFTVDQLFPSVLEVLTKSYLKEKTKKSFSQLRNALDSNNSVRPGSQEINVEMSNRDNRKFNVESVKKFNIDSFEHNIYDPVVPDIDLSFVCEKLLKMNIQDLVIELRGLLLINDIFSDKDLKGNPKILIKRPESSKHVQVVDQVMSALKFKKIGHGSIDGIMFYVRYEL